MKQKFMKFMYGRYGNDELNTLLLISSVILTLLSPLVKFFSSLSMVCLVFAIFRMFSKNIYQRRMENAKVVPYISFVKAKFKNKGYKVFLCPNCKKTLRVPRGKGKITISCPCGHTLKRKS